MMQNKRVIGITGGSGCGKSYLCKKLEDKGFLVIDCDKIAAEVMEPGSACLLETAEVFGAEILDEGRLNRKKLAEIVFSDGEKLLTLNKITHKYILERIYNMIENAEPGLIFVDGAVLIESGVRCDMMVGILADRDIRRRRIMVRDGLTDDEATRRIGAQKPNDFYEENCDIIVYNNEEDVDIDALLERIVT